MKEELISYGLSEKEANVYLAALQLGDCTANRITEKTGLPRSTVYDVIESLEKKELIASYKKDKKYYFSANDPKSLINYLKEKEQIVSRILPELKNLQESGSERPLVTVFKGKVGLRTAADEMLTAKEILVYGASKNADKIFTVYTENFAQRRIEKKITLKTIIGPSIPEYMTSSKAKKYTPIRTLEIFEDHDVTYFIYDNNVLIWTLGDELIATKVQSKTFADSQRKIFDFLWKQAKK